MVFCDIVGIEILSEMFRYHCIRVAAVWAGQPYGVLCVLFLPRTPMLNSHAPCLSSMAANMVVPIV